MLSKRGGTESQQIEFYKQIQDKLHQEAERYRALGEKENADYLEDLQKQWWTYASEIEKIYDNIRKIAIDSLKFQVEQQQKQVNLYKSAITVATDAIDGQIKALEEQKKALQAQNDEEDRAIKLEKLKTDLFNAQSQKNIRVWYSDIGFVWETNAEKIKDAEKALKDFETEEQIRAIDKQIDSWQKYKDQWSSVVSNYDKEQNRLMVLEQFGANFEAEVLSQRLSVVTNFANDYIKQMEKLETAQKKLEKTEMTIATPSGIVPTKTGYDKNVDYSSLIHEAEKSGASKELLSGLEQARNEKIIGEGLQNKYPTTNKYGSYADGGIIDYTGLANVHGSNSKPEMILNSNQIGGLFNMIKSFITPQFSPKLATTNGSTAYNFDTVNIIGDNPRQIFGELKQYAITHSNK